MHRHTPIRRDFQTTVEPPRNSCDTSPIEVDRCEATLRLTISLACQVLPNPYGLFRFSICVRPSRHRQAVILTAKQSTITISQRESLIPCFLHPLSYRMRTAPCVPCRRDGGMVKRLMAAAFGGIGHVKREPFRHSCQSLPCGPEMRDFFWEERE